MNGLDKFGTNMTPQSGTDCIFLYVGCFQNCLLQITTNLLDMIHAISAVVEMLYNSVTLIVF